MENIEKTLQELSRSEDFLFDYSITSETECEVLIEWGDWKHEHGYLDYLMKKNGFIKVDEKITEEDGSDCFSAIHYFKLKDK